MATDKLPNSTQMEDVVTALQTIAQKSNTPYNPDNKLPSDYVNDASQTHKFATQAQLDQIATNQTNVLLSYNLDGQHNLLPLENGIYTASTSTITIKDGVATLKSVDTSTHFVTVGSFMMKAGTYVLFNRYTSTGNGDIRLIKGSTSITTGNPATFTLDEDAKIIIQFYTYNAIAESTIQPMLVTKAQYDAGLRDFQPFALPNTTLTPALVECVDSGAKNEFYFERVETGNNGSYSLNGDTITITGTAPWAQARCYFNVRESGDYTVSVKVTSLTTQKAAINIQDATTSIPVTSGISISATGTYTLKVTLDSTHNYWATLMVNNTSSTISLSNIVFTDIMVCKSELYDVSPTYQPYALPNTTITPALQECVDNGAKNLLDFSASTPIAPPGTTVTDNGDGTYTIAKTSSNLDIPYIAAYIKAGTYIYSGCPAGGSDSTYRLDIRTSTGSVVGGGDYGDGVKITIPSDDWYRITCRLDATYTTSGLTIKPMMCNFALWAVSHKFVSYAKNNANLTANVLSLQDNYVKSAITNTGTSFTPDTNCQYMVLIQSGTSSALYGVYKTSVVNIAKIVGNLTTDSVTESGGVVTISISAWSVISVFRIGF